MHVIRAEYTFILISQPFLGCHETFSKLGSVVALNSRPHEVMLISAFPKHGTVADCGMTKIVQT
jgi:hypothetical protein